MTGVQTCALPIFIDVIGFGKFGRVYIGGDEAEVLECKTIVEKRLAEITGREDY